MKLVCSLVLLTALGSWAQTQPRSTVQSSGSASVSVTPDQAQIYVSAVTQAPTAQDAANQNATIASNLISQLTQALGNSGTVKTVNYSVSPNYSYPNNAPPVLTGYTVTNSIQVTLNDLTVTGKIIDTATQAGASRVDNLQFSLKDDTEPRSQALKSATLKAKSKAEAMASAVGLRTGAFLVIQEAGSVIQPVITTGAPGAASGTPVQPGQLTVTANVTISVELIQ